MHAHHSLFTLRFLNITPASTRPITDPTITTLQSDNPPPPIPSVQISTLGKLRCVFQTSLLFEGCEVSKWYLFLSLFCTSTFSATSPFLRVESWTDNPPITKPCLLNLSPHFDMAISKNKNRTSTQETAARSHVKQKSKTTYRNLMVGYN